MTKPNTLYENYMTLGDSLSRQGQHAAAQNAYFSAAAVMWFEPRGQRAELAKAKLFAAAQAAVASLAKAMRNG